ncbi:ubiquitin carboxyl-terminal hydrolase 15-like [Chlorella sorokiniana]|uniref:phytol kinase n=1 Tax=Chlorella sorokiniana TaxID=3076 RepID=A0A2P6TR10_CHLSO|nr:ubiquitin carboxyl-terminal hydrolase 15-like [Chlorella sorokiniana]|eukprot:PRW56505.1 ubiquitin carboxyl-terminal hydrolase 15-like [Chlorella sorokiniana]
MDSASAAEMYRFNVAPPCSTPAAAQAAATAQPAVMDEFALTGKLLARYTAAATVCRPNWTTSSDWSSWAARHMQDLLDVVHMLDDPAVSSEFEAQARQQRSGYWTAKFAALLLVWVLDCSPNPSLAEVEQAVAAQEEGEAELRRFKRWLPDAWQLQPVAAARLHMLRFREDFGQRQRAALSGPPNPQLGVDLLSGLVAMCEKVGAAREASEQARQENPQPSVRVVCDGCKRTALGLRLCARCRSCRYCSRQCQVKHWKEGGHKQQCAALAAKGAGDSSK